MSLIVAVDDAIIIQIHEAEVTWLGIWLQWLAMLVGVWLHLCLVLEDTCCLVTPELAERFTLGIANDVVAAESTCPDVIAIQFHSLVLYLRKVQTYAVGEVLDLVVPVDTKFPTCSLHLT